MTRAAPSATSLPRLSRSLLAPGPQPPLSHFGATLMRHVVGTVARYSLYQLGLPMPESPPVRILRLRVFLDAAPLEAAIGAAPGGAEIVAALLQPAGAGELDATAARVRAAAALHRARLAALGPRRGRGVQGRRPAAPEPAPDAHSRSAGIAADPDLGRPAGASPAPTGRGREELWSAVCSVLAGRMPYLCDAGLGELVAALARRRRRLAGQTVRPAIGQVAWLVHHDLDADLRALGPLDPCEASWGDAGIAADDLRERAARARAGAKPGSRPGRRGAFREAYRWVLSEIRPLLLELGDRAREDGLVDAAGDVFFIPFDLGAELAGARRPAWLAAAVATNRREHEALYREPEHADEIEGPASLAGMADRSASWDVAPLLYVE